MRVKPSIAGVTLLGLAATVGATESVATGTTWQGPFPINIEQAIARTAARSAELDTNRDGKISRDEFLAFRPDEVRGAHGFQLGRHHRGHPPARDGDDGLPALPFEGQPQRPLAEMEPQIFAHLDTDGDGKLSRDEWGIEKQHDVMRTLIREQRFSQLDKNGDGVLEPDEQPDPTARLKAMDSDSDGTVSREEARAYRRSHRGGAD